MDPLTRLQAAVVQARPVVAGTASSSLAGPTPCADWDVRAVLNHMLGVLMMFRDVATDNHADPSLFDRDLIGRDPLESFDKLAAQTVAAWRARGLGGIATLPFGECPAGFALGLPTMEMVVHAWDLATATNKAVDWDQNLLVDTLRFARATFTPSDARGASFLPQIPVADDAPTIEQLVGFLGRTAPVAAAATPS
jgi:uncharacterized protein (TIGR03086 family)